MVSRLDFHPLPLLTQLPEKESVVAKTPSAKKSLSVKVTDADCYVSFAQLNEVIDQSGDIRFPCQDPILLTPEDQARIQHFWSRFQKKKFNLHQFLKFFIGGIFAALKDAAFYQTEGAFAALGKEFWQKQLSAKIDLVEVTPDMWNFCEAPHCLAFWVCLPPTCKNEQVSWFQKWAIFLKALQTLPGHPESIEGAMREFTAVFGNGQSDRLEQIRKKISEIQKDCRERKNTLDSANDPLLTSLEVPCGGPRSLKIVFSPKKPETFNNIDLQICPEGEDLACKITGTSPWQTLHDALINRVHPPTSIRQFLAFLWAAQTRQGAIYQGDALEKELIARSDPQLESQINLIYKRGLRYLSGYSDARIAYTWNAIFFLQRHQFPVPQTLYDELGKMTPDAPSGIGALLVSEDFRSRKLDDIVQLIALLSAHLEIDGAPKCRKVFGRDLLELSWQSGLAVVHLLLPLDYDRALKTVVNPEMIKSYGRVLDLFIPSASQLPQLPERSIPIDPRHISLYLWFAASSPLAARQFLFLLAAHGWKAKEEREVLALPRLLGLSVAQGCLEELLPVTQAVFQGSRFAALYAEMERKALESRHPSAERVHFEALKPLVSCADAQLSFRGWSAFSDLSKELSNDDIFQFLIELSASPHSEVLNRAYNRVIALSRRQQLSDEHLTLLSHYFERLHQLKAFNGCYAPLVVFQHDPLLEALERGITNHPSGCCALLPFPRAFESVFSTPQMVGYLLTDLKTRCAESFLEQNWWKGCVKAFELTEDDPEGTSQLVQLMHVVVELLLQKPKERSLWANFKGILAKMDRRDLLLDNCLRLRETMALQLHQLSPKSAPYQCLAAPIPDYERRLTAAQKLRFAKVYAKLKIEGELPSGWIEKTLQEGNAWDDYTLFVITREKPNLKTLREVILPHFLDLSPSVASKVLGFLGKVPASKLTAKEWKAALVDLVVRVPTCTTVFPLLMGMATAEEKTFFTKCQALPEAALQQQLQEYQKTGKPPEPPKQELFQDALKGKQFQNALALLREMPGDEYPLWQTLLQALQASNVWHQFRPACTAAWLEKHPAVRVQASQGEFWALALGILFEDARATRSGFIAFLTEHALPLLRVIEGPSFKTVASFFFKRVVDLCQGQKPEDQEPLVKAFAPITADPVVANKVYTTDCIDINTESRWYLLLTQQKEESLFRRGDGGFSTLVNRALDTQNIGTIENGLLFSNYCNSPYDPKIPHTQGVFFEWIEKSWTMHKKMLTWNQTCQLVIRICAFDYPAISSDQTPRYLDDIYRIWSAILEVTTTLQLIEGKFVEDLNRHVRSVAFYLQATSVAMHLMVHTANDAENALSLLKKMRATVGAADCLEKQTQRFLKIEYFEAIANYFQMYQPTDCSSMKEALCDLMEGWVIFEEKGSHKEITKSFFSSFKQALPAILNCADEELFALLGKAIQSLMKFPAFVFTPEGKQNGWLRILFELCNCMESVSEERKPVVVKFVRGVYLNCMRADKLPPLPRGLIVESFVKANVISFALFFAAKPETRFLSTNEWVALVSNIENTQLQDALWELLKTPDKNQHFDRIKYNLAAARLIRHARTRDQKLLNFLETCSSLATGENFKEEASKLPREEYMHFLFTWIQTMDTLIKRCDEAQREVYMPTAARHIAWMHEFAQRLFAEKNFHIPIDAFRIKELAAILIYHFENSSPIRSDLQEVHFAKLKNLKQNIALDGPALWRFIANSRDTQNLVGFQQEVCLSAALPPEDAPAEEQLHQLFYLIKAFSLLTERGDFEKIKLSDQFFEMKMDLAEEYLKISLSLIQNMDSFKKMTLPIKELAADLDIADYWQEAFRIDPTLPDELQLASRQFVLELLQLIKTSTGAN